MRIPLMHPNGARRVVWKMGRAAEKHVRDSYIKGVDWKNVLGIWSCNCDSLKQRGEFIPGERCERCGSEARNYNELSLYDHDAQIVGNPDLLITPYGQVIVTEIKSMNKTEFDKLEAPVQDHVFQGLGYHRLAIKEGFDVAPFILVYYVCKDFIMRGSVYKEFVVYPEHHHVMSLNMIWGEAEAIKTHRAAGTLPPRTLCTEVHSGKAKACAVVGDCFTRRSIRVGESHAEN